MRENAVTPLANPSPRLQSLQALVYRQYGLGLVKDLTALDGLHGATHRPTHDFPAKGMGTLASVQHPPHTGVVDLLAGSFASIVEAFGLYETKQNRKTMALRTRE